jgi:para-nitrobenzyl esterase
MARCHAGHEVPRGYRALRPEAGPAEIVGQMVTDHLLRRPLHRLADSRPGSSYVYEFAWSSQRPGLGACHALELGFVFDSGEVPDSAKLAGEGAPQDLADAMHAAWVRFTVDGSPGWEAWDTAHPVQIFGDGEPYTAYGPRDAELALWTAGPAATPPESTPAPAPADGAPARSTDARSVARLLRRPGGVRRH